MPRPKGSKNRKHKKRKYTRRKTDVTISLDHETLAQVSEAKTLVTSIKEMLMEADPEVARSAISVLIHDLAMVNRIVGGVPPAP